MLSKIARLILTASAIAPVSFTYAWVAFMQSQYRIALISVVTGVVAVIACIGVLSYARSHIESLPFQATAIEPADTESMGFMLLYILPLFTDSVSSLHWELWIPIIIVFSVIVATGFGYHFNPLLGLMQWHFYKVTSKDGVSYVLITKKYIRSAAQELRVGQLTEYILLDLEYSHG
jgi:hypothetical protein